MSKLVLVKTNKNQTVDELLKPFGINQKTSQKKIKWTKEQIIKKEKNYILKVIKDYERILFNHNISICNRLKIEKSIQELNVIYYKEDEEIYKLAIKNYSKDLIDSNGDIYNSYNPYAKWIYYNKYSKNANLLVIKNPNNPKEYINVNTAKYKDIVWDKVKYNAILTDAILFDDGIWYEQEECICTLARINENQEATFEEKSMNKVIPNNPEDIITIV